MSAADWPAVARIYAAGIRTGEATFERDVPTWERWLASRGGFPSIVAKDSTKEVLGWAALTPVSQREVYRGVGAVSIYVDPDHTGEGVGRALLSALLQAAEQAGIWTVEAGIFPENRQSVRLHEALGFRLVGVRERLGQMPDGRWQDVLLYERRSETIGLD
jgi:phosphinothricin acetyltransferase